MVVNQKNPGHSISLYPSDMLTSTQRIAAERSDRYEDVLCMLDDSQEMRDCMKLLTNNKATFEDIVVTLPRQIRSTNIHILIECENVL